MTKNNLPLLQLLTANDQPSVTPSNNTLIVFFNNMGQCDLFNPVTILPWKVHWVTAFKTKISFQSETNLRKCVCETAASQQDCNLQDYEVCGYLTPVCDLPQTAATKVEGHNCLEHLCTL